QRRLHFQEPIGQLIQRLDIVNAHEVEAEAIDMILLNPVFARFDDVLAHHGTFGGRLVAASGGI
ncbi:MAG: hypothetical protein JNK10_15660, partial [Cyclobacteriaceae bacterium]|nr:hypothetical protein [Cyclobacteriaceae bacterium]